MSDHWITEVEQGAVLLSVNQRLSRYYIRQYSDWQLESNKQWWETPTILPLSGWVEQIHAQCVANGTSNKTLLANIASDRIWQQIIAQDASSSDLLDKDLAATSGLKAWQVANHWTLAGAAEDDLSASDDQRAFARWREAYKRYCKSHQCIDLAVINDHVATLLSDATNPIELPQTILLAGFLTIPTQLQRLLDTLTKRGVGVQHIKPTRSAKIQRVEYAEDDDAFNHIASQVRQVLHSESGQTIGVVVHDLQQRRSQVLRAFDTVFFPALSPVEIEAIGRPYDLSIGLPLNEQSVIRSALHILKLLTSGLTGTELSAFLLSAHLPGSDFDRSLRQKADRTCRDQRIRHAHLSHLKSILNEKDILQKSLAKLTKRKWSKTAGAAVWAENFGKAIKDIGWPGKSVGSEEYQAVEAWNKCLDDFQILDDGQAIDQNRALNLLIKLCKSRLFQLETAGTPIQIMGRLESHGIEFDKLWVTGLDADLWPPVSSPTSFLSIEQQVAAGVPDATPSARLAHAESELHLWKSSTAQLYVCHAKTRDGLELNPAPIIKDEALVEGELALIDHIDVPALIQSGINIEKVEDTHGPELEAGTEVRGGTRLLENQARCPFKAFALHRLRIKKLEEAGIGLDPRQHGTTFHESMEFFWDAVSNHANLVAMSEDELQKQCNASIELAMVKCKVEEKLQPIQKRYLLRLMTEWLEQVEARRQPFVIEALEQDIDMDIAGVKINVKVDRVDRLDDGKTIVLDYKTGNNNNIKTWGQPRIENPQLPLYVGANKDVQGVCFAQVFPNQYRMIGTTAEDGMIDKVKSPENTTSLKKTIDDWEHAKEHWKSSLELLATEIRGGLASITPVDKACDFCELPSLCRIDKNLADEDHERNEDQPDGAAGGEP